MRDKDTCPIWGTSAVVGGSVAEGGLRVNSPRTGGEYFVDGSSIGIGDWYNDFEKARLTTWLIKQRRLGALCPVIPHDLQSACNDHRELKSIINRRALSVHARADELLKYISTKTSDIGLKFEFWVGSTYDDEMEALAYTESVNYWELEYLLTYLEKREWVEEGEIGEFETPECHSKYTRITVEGHARLAELEQVVTDSSQAFVAMWFDDSVEDAWTQGIKPAIENAGYNPVLIKNQEFLGKIDDQIIAELRRSRFLVADFTQGDDGARGGVYYEAGFAHGLNIPVIFTARKDIVDRKLIHFDTRQYNHIDWENPEELRERLTHRISAEIGDGPSKNNTNK